MENELKEIIDLFEIEYITNKETGEHTYRSNKLDRKTIEWEKEKQNAKDTYEMWQALIKSFNILQKENSNLRQALNDIEDIVFGDYEVIDPLGKQQILNIIDNVKGDSNEYIFN